MSAEVGEYRLDDVGDRAQLREERRDALVGERALHLRELEREHRERGDLRRECLGRGDTDLGTRMRVEDAVGLARDARADHVGDRDDLRAAVARLAHAGERVGRLAGLRDRDDERALVDDRVRVAELARALHLDGDARPVLDQVLRREARRAATCRTR